MEITIFITFLVALGALMRWARPDFLDMDKSAVEWDKKRKEAGNE